MILHPKDELGDFEDLDVFKEEELFDLQQHYDTLLAEIRAAVEGVMSGACLPAPIKIEASAYRGGRCDIEYELEATIAFQELWTSEAWKEEQEIKKIEERIKSSGVLDAIGKRIGVKIGLCCYVPFSLPDLV